MKKNNITEAANVRKYLVNYSLGDHYRISNTQSNEESLQIYHKYQADHNLYTTTLFSLYQLGYLNNLSKNFSLFFRILRKLMILQLRSSRHLCG
jgi:hypothetical protein